MKKTGAGHFCFLLLICFLVVSAVSCGSVPKVVPETEVKKESTPVSEIKTSIRPPASLRRTYFYNINESIIQEVENGSPSSLRHAVEMVRKPGGEYTENEKVLFSVAAGIMKLVWTDEKVDWETPAVTDATPYLGAISSAGKGIYDMSTGNVDFLATILPSLVIPSSSSVDDFFASAESALLSCLALRPSSVLANYLLGLLYLKQGNNSSALGYFTSALLGASDCMQISYEQAVCLNNLGKTDEAAVIAGMLAGRFPADIRVLKLCAGTSFALKNYTAAEEYVARVLQQDPNDLDYVLFRARILVEKGDYIRAASLLDVYARQDNSSRDYLLLRARIQRDWSKNIAAAVATMETALKKYPGDKEVLLFSAQLAASTGSAVGSRTAEELAETILATEPNNSAALQCAVEGMVRSGSWQKAYAASSTLLAKTPENRQIQFLYIKICLALGKKDEAWNMVSALYRADPGDEDVIQSYITVLTETGRTNQAVVLIKDKLPSADSRLKSFLYYKRSIIAATQEESLADLRSSLIANPRNNDSLLRLYQIYYDRRDYRKAQYYLKQVVALNPDDATIRKLNDDLTRLIK